MNLSIGLAGVVLGFVASLGGIVTIGIGLAQRRPRLLLAGRTYVWIAAAGAVIAFAIAALVTGRLGEGWLIETRRWTLFAWGFLSVGVVLGAWWIYEVLGWAGAWAWDQDENAS